VIIIPEPSRLCEEPLLKLENYLCMAEIKEVDATMIPVPSSTAVQVSLPFKDLNSILTECITASVPVRVYIPTNVKIDAQIFKQVILLRIVCIYFNNHSAWSLIIKSRTGTEAVMHSVRIGI
jgi:hypothetical protein